MAARQFQVVSLEQLHECGMSDGAITWRVQSGRLFPYFRAVYAIVPLVKKRVSGQIAGIAGAYGNVGGLAFLTILLFVGNRAFFLVIAAASVISTLVARFWLVEPAASFSAELLTDEVLTDEAVAELPGDEVRIDALPATDDTLVPVGSHEPTPATLTADAGAGPGSVRELATSASEP